MYIIPANICTGSCKGHDHKCHICSTSGHCQNTGNKANQYICRAKDNPTKQAGLVKKIVVVTCLALFLLAGSFCVSVTNGHAFFCGPDNDVIKDWLKDSKVVVGKQYKYLDRTEKINVVNIRALNVIDCKEIFEKMPNADNHGTLWINFTYISGGNKLDYSAVLHYAWKYISMKKVRILNSTTIEDRNKR